MPLTQEKITALKKLTALTGGENLSIESVLDSFQTIQNLSIDPHSSVSRSGQGVLLPREDRVSSSDSLSDALLDCSHQRVMAHQIALGSIMHGE